MIRAGVARPDGIRGVLIEEGVLDDAVDASRSPELGVSGKTVPAHECKLTSKSRQTKELGGTAYRRAE